jgi:hypothetical protein
MHFTLRNILDWHDVFIFVTIFKPIVVKKDPILNRNFKICYQISAVAGCLLMKHERNSRVLRHVTFTPLHFTLTPNTCDRHRRRQVRASRRNKKKNFSDIMVDGKNTHVKIQS